MRDGTYTSPWLTEDEIRDTEKGETSIKKAWRQWEEKKGWTEAKETSPSLKCLDAAKFGT
jgi:hypothetical protein